MKKFIIYTIKNLSAKKIVNPQKEKIAEEKRIWQSKNPF